LLHILNSWRA